MTAPGSSRDRLRATLTAAILLLAVAACDAAGVPVASMPGGAGVTASPVAATPSPSADPAAAPSPTGPARIALPVEPDATVEGLVEVDGHDIYARCAGDGPTVVSFTGWAAVDKRATTIAQGIERALGSEVRMCSYDRRNTGLSETVRGTTQTPEDVIADVDGVLAALGEDGPFVLLGASFGGIVASAYAVAHPERVAGVVLLDAATGAEYEIEEAHDFTGACYGANRDADAWSSMEKLDNCAMYEWVHERRDREPDVPLLFLAAQDGSTRGSADDAARIAWVEGWDPGEWRVVSAPHWMDEADTALVAAAIRDVIGGLR